MRTKPPPPPASTRNDAVDAALARSKRRRGVPIRNSFIQIDRGPGPLADLVSRRQHNALELYLTLLMLGTSARDDHSVSLPAVVWGRVIGLEDATVGPSMSRLWKTLADHNLVERQRQGRHLTVRPLREDGTGATYRRPTSAYLRVPLEYWSDRWYDKLTLPGKAMLLLSLTQRSRFELTLARVPAWYGLSEDTAQQGMAELTALKLISASEHYEPAPLSPTGYRTVRTWTLHKPVWNYVAAAEN